ncbi:hypothetical protein HK104_005152, partial [Borealophlyctis nickersoniae]
MAASPTPFHNTPPPASIPTLLAIIALNTARRGLIIVVTGIALTTAAWAAVEWYLNEYRLQRAGTAGKEDLIKIGFLLWLYPSRLRLDAWGEDNGKIWLVVFFVTMLGCLNCWVMVALLMHYQPTMTLWAFFASNFLIHFVSFWPAHTIHSGLLYPEEGWRGAFKRSSKFTAGYLVSVWAGWIMTAVALWLAGAAKASSMSTTNQILSIFVASIGYPLVKFIYLKAMEPAWRGWAPSSNETETLISAQRDMGFTIAYDCLFGVGGRIIVLRQSTFVGFCLALLGSAAFDFALGWWETVKFRRAIGKTVWPEEGADQEGPKVVVGRGDKKETFDVDRDVGANGVTLDGAHKGVGVGLAASNRILRGTLFDLRAEFENPKHVASRQVAPVGDLPSTLPGSRDKYLLAPSGLGNLYSPSRHGSIAGSDKEAAVAPPPIPSPPADVENQSDDISQTKTDATTVDTSASKVPLSLSRKAWAAHRLATTAADQTFRLIAFYTVLLFISISPPSYHTCNGYVTAHDLSIRLACSLLLSFITYAASLALDKRVTGVRYAEVMRWVPRMRGFAYGMACMLVVAGGVGPVLSVDAGLFGGNECFE